MAKKTVEVAGYLATFLKVLGLAANVAVAVAPAFTKDEKTLENLNKAQTAAQAANQVADGLKK